jgi:nitroreductase
MVPTPHFGVLSADATILPRRFDKSHSREHEISVNDAGPQTPSTYKPNRKGTCGVNETIQRIRNRRTIRRYKLEQIAEQELSAILDAGLHAPNAGGGQSAVIVACQDAALNEELGRLSRAAETNIGPNATPVSSEQPSIRDDPSLKSGFYGAPTVLTLFAPKENYNLTGDCFVAAENMVIAAWSLGIGSCIVGRAASAFSTVRGREIQAAWGLSDEYEARLHVTLGYPVGGTPSYKPRKENRVIRV